MIKMQCSSPKRAKGEYDLEGYEDFTNWIIANIRGGKTKVARIQEEKSGVQLRLPGT